MIFFRKSRFLLLVTRELSRKYTFPLIVGFFLGLIGMIGFHQVTSRFSYQPFAQVLRIGLVGDATPSTLPADIQELISSGLSRLGPDGLPLPSLATKWEATDSGRTFVFTIAENARWHNGLGVKAPDINYNIGDVTFTVMSPYALRATLKEPFAPFLTLVAKPILQSGLKGFGQYRVKNIRLKGEAVQYLQLESVNALSVPDREYRFYRTESAAVTGFQLGDVDILEDISSPAVFEGWKNASVSAQPHYNRVVALYFNTKEQVLSEKGFRQALGFAIPDLGFQRAYSPISKTSWAYTDTVKKYDFDINQAKKLMANAKIASESASLTITTFSQYIDIVQKIATSWTNLGVPTNVQIVNQIGQFQVLLSAQSIPPDPDQYPLWHSTQSQTNLTGYVNVKIDKLLEDGRKELNQDIRKKIYIDFAKRLIEDAPAIFLYYPTTYTVTRVK